MRVPPRRRIGERKEQQKTRALALARTQNPDPRTDPLVLETLGEHQYLALTTDQYLLPVVNTSTYWQDILPV